MKRFIQKTRTLIILVALLLLSNIAVVCYFLLWNKPDTERRVRDSAAIERRIQKELGFTSEQAVAFHALFQANSDSLKMLGDQVRRAKDNFYRYIREPALEDSAVQQAARELAQRQLAVEWQWFHHFRQVRALCTEPQQAQYDSLITRMINRRMAGRSAGRPPSLP